LIKTEVGGIDLFLFWIILHGIDSNASKMLGSLLFVKKLLKRVYHTQTLLEGSGTFIE
jgi:hypothetical protein